MKFQILTFIFFILTYQIFSQCNGNQNFTITPLQPVGGYTPGTVINICYTMTGWNGLGIQNNWVEGFDINLGSGLTNLTPQSPPDNCNGVVGGTTEGEWIWVNSVTSISTGITVGPGWFFDRNPLDGNPGNDWGDYGTCTWSFCFTVTVAPSCTLQNLLIQVTAGADGTYGSWTNNACSQTPFTIFNGTSNPSLPIVGNISHN
jgi:hypothetical protein